MPDGFKFEAPNLKKIVAALTGSGGDEEQAVGRALFEGGNEIMTTSKDKFVPVDTGALKNSGFVDFPQVSRSKVTVTLKYGGPASSYAAIVHEDLQATHTVGQPKYLERPVLEAIDDVGDKVNEAVTDAIRNRLRRAG